MTDKNSELQDGLKQAIKGERDGHSFYLMAAKGTQDEKGKEVFETLAAEELDHMQFLIAQYNSVLETGKPNMAVKLGSKFEFSKMSPIFSEGLKSRIKDAHIEMSALSIGIQLELEAMQFYKEQYEKSDDEHIKKFYAELAEWESGHYHALLSQQEELKGDYWTESGFAPF